LEHRCNDPFHFDDALITNDSNVTNPAQMGAFFFHPLYLRQLTFFSFYLNHLVGGLNPAGFHGVNVAIHIANAVCCFCYCGVSSSSGLRGRRPQFSSLIPIQTEAVLYFINDRSARLFFSLCWH
jgi:hypothetical protein